MQHLSGHERVLGLLAVEGTGAGLVSPGLTTSGGGPPPGPRAAPLLEDVFIVASLMDTDLCAGPRPRARAQRRAAPRAPRPSPPVRAAPPPPPRSHKTLYSRQKLTIGHAAYWVYQLLTALKYIHAAGVLHRDLKPSNLLINADCTLRLCDFGLARSVDGASGALTEYVVTRWYRAPEIMLGQRAYTSAVDVWAAGAILGEVLKRAPLWPGRDYAEQLKMIVATVGSPAADRLDFVSSDRARAFLNKLAGRPRAPWAAQGIAPPPGADAAAAHAHAAALDLLDRMLAFDPRQRITVDAALAHPFLSSVRSRDAEHGAPPIDCRFEDGVFTRETVQAQTWQEICAGSARAPSTPTIPPPSLALPKGGGGGSARSDDGGGAPARFLRPIAAYDDARRAAAVGRLLGSPEPDDAGATGAVASAAAARASVAAAAAAAALPPHLRGLGLARGDETPPLGARSAGAASSRPTTAGTAREGTVVSSTSAQTTPGDAARSAGAPASSWGGWLSSLLPPS